LSFPPRMRTRSKIGGRFSCLLSLMARNIVLT
jgi:hypothetical protein